MGLWIYDPGYDEVTGTVVMLSSPDTPGSEETEGKQQPPGLKANKDGVILSPQPQNDPNDPLNWPVWRRDVSLFVIGFYSFLIGGQTPLLASVFSQFTVTFHKSLHTLTYLVGGLMLSMGVGSLLFAPTAVLYGKRLVYLITQAIFFAGCIWGANANSFGSLMGARVLTGIGGGPAESLPSATIAEIYFAHERAYRTGIYTLLLLGGKNLVPLVAGFIAHGLGWHWIYWIQAIIAGSALVATFLFVHETWWDRTPVPNKRSQKESELARQAREAMHRPQFRSFPATRPIKSELAIPTIARLGQEASSGPNGSEVDLKRRSLDDNNHVAFSSAPIGSPETHGANLSASEPDTSVASAAPHGDHSIPAMPARIPFLRNLAVYTGRKSPDAWWQVFLRPFWLYTYIPILFSTLLYATSVVWLSVIAETISAIFTKAPYHFPATSVGLLYIGTFIGGCLGSAIAGKASDLLVRALSSRNNKVYEPEFRLLMVFPVMITVTIGLMGFGWSTFDKDHWIVPAIFLGFLGFGTSLGSTVAITYAVDCYRHLAAESLVALNFFKNVLGFCFGVFVPFFFDSAGSKTIYVVFGSIEVALCLLAIPLYRYGKALRAHRDRNDIIRVLYR